MEKQLISFLDSFLEMGVPGFRTVILKNGEKIFDYTNGYLDKEKKLPYKEMICTSKVSNFWGAYHF